MVVIINHAAVIDEKLITTNSLYNYTKFSIRVNSVPHLHTELKFYIAGFYMGSSCDIKLTFQESRLQ